MEDFKIEGMAQSGQLEPAQLKGPHRRCIYDPETICAAPRAQFQACKTCYLMSPHQAVSNLFDKIKKLAADIFNLPEAGPDQFPPQK